MNRPRVLVALLLVALVGAVVRVQVAPAHDTTPGERQARRIVCAVFGSTCQAALNVIRCETGSTFSVWSRNRSSGAFGWFQWIPGNHGRVLEWNGRRVTIDYSRAWQPWYASRVTYVWTRGGTDWHEWTCRP